VWRLDKLLSAIREHAGLASTRPTGRTLGMVAAAYALLAIVFTYPVIQGVLSQAAGSTDVYEYMWEVWWAKRSLIDLRQSPADLTGLYYPYGAQHPLLLSDAYLMLTSLPLVLLFSPAAAINVHLLLSYALTGMTTYLLCFYLTRQHWASFIGGAVFAFSPFRSDRAAHGVITMALTYWLPLYALFLLRVFRRPNRTNATMTGLTLGFSSLSSFLHLAHFVVPFTVVFLGYQHFADRRRLYSAALWRAIGLAGGVAALMVLPWYLPLLGAKLGGELDYFSRFGILGHSAALLAFVIPPSFQVVIRQSQSVGALVEQLLPGRYYVVYLGVVSLALAAIGLTNKRARLWAAVASVSGILALGPLLHVTGELLPVAIADRTGFVVLPGALLTGLPFYEWARGPARFAELTILAVAVMASFGLLRLSRFSGRRVANMAVAGLLLALLLLDYALFLPFPKQSLAVPEFYQSLQAEGGGYGVLDVGTERFNHEGMYFQTVHQLPIARGFIYRYPSGSQYYQEFLDQLVCPQGDIVNVGGLVPRLQQLGIGVVVLHRLSEAKVAELGPYLAERLGQPLYEDGQIVAYGVPQGEVAAGHAGPLLMLGEGWHPMEMIDGVPSRWMIEDGVVYAMADEGGRYQLSLNVHPFRVPRSLEIYVGGQRLEEYDVGGMQRYRTSPFELASGEWVPITFHAPGGCEVPSEVVEGQEDDRCLSMLFQELQVTAECCD
jgi:hypothetical protein